MSPRMFPLLHLLLRRLSAQSAWRLRSGLCGLVLLFICLGYVLLAVGVHTRIGGGGAGPGEKGEEAVRDKRRHVRDLMAQGKRRAGSGGNGVASSSFSPYLDVLRLRPKVPNLPLDGSAIHRGSFAGFANATKEEREAILEKMKQVLQSSYCEYYSAPQLFPPSPPFLNRSRPTGRTCTCGP